MSSGSTVRDEGNSANLTGSGIRSTTRIVSLGHNLPCAGLDPRGHPQACLLQKYWQQVMNVLEALQAPATQDGRQNLSQYLETKRQRTPSSACTTCEGTRHPEGPSAVLLPKTPVQAL